MYSRSYGNQSPAMGVPNDYGGTALLEDVHTEPAEEPTTAADNADTVEVGASPEHGSGISSWLSRLTRGNLLGGSSFLEHFGTEEILIIAAALVLLLSPERDIECALMLLVLLFIG